VEQYKANKRPIHAVILQTGDRAMRSQSRWRIAVVTIVLAACAPPAAPDDLKATEPPPMASPQLPVRTTPAGEAAAQEQAIADLAARLNIAPSAISVVSQDSAVWPNAGLGCPQPGIGYTEVQIDGMRIILSYAGIRYEYHSGPARVILCETDGVRVGLTAIPLSPIEPTEEITMTSTLKIESGMQSLIDAAIADLMKRLSVTQDEIEVVSAQSVVWPDKGLGCPAPGMQYLQVQVDGFRIVLRAHDQLYAYHGGGGRGPFLCENPAK
jgi:hypothetical protein